MFPEELDRQEIDGQLAQCGWLAQSLRDMKITAGLGVAVREVGLGTEKGENLLLLDGKVPGFIEDNPSGFSLKAAETPGQKYRSGVKTRYLKLQGEEVFSAENEEGSLLESDVDNGKKLLPVVCNSLIPIEEFDIIVDECHRSIYNLWRQVLAYFDAYLVGLTATPTPQTIGFFKQNIVRDYSHEHAVGTRSMLTSTSTRTKRRSSKTEPQKKNSPRCGFQDSTAAPRPTGTKNSTPNSRISPASGIETSLWIHRFAPSFARPKKSGSTKSFRIARSSPKRRFSPRSTCTTTADPSPKWRRASPASLLLEFGSQKNCSRGSAATCIASHRLGESLRDI